VIVSRCLSLLLVSTLTWADAPRAEVRQNEVWFVNDDHQKQLTRDGKAKLQAVLSPLMDRIAYYEQCPQQEKCTPSVVILDLDGERLQSFQARPQAISPDSGPCASILNIFWVWSGAIGVECHATPSTSEYVEVDLATGKNVRELVGLEFTPSPDAKWVAHVGPIIHFAPRYAQSYYLMIDNTTVYPLPKGAKPKAQKPADQPIDVVQQRGNRFIGIHEFVQTFYWSPDASQVAFIDCTFDWVMKGVGPDNATPIGDETNRGCSLAVVALDGTFSLFPLPEIPLDSIRDAQVSWQDSHQVQVTSQVTKRFRVP
jgi:hypothetical protein